MHCHTNSNAALARSNRLTPEDLPLAQDARVIWLAVTGEKHGPVMERISRTPIKWIVYRLRRMSERSCPLELIARIVVWLANVGVSEAQLRMIPLYLTRVIEECFAGNAHRSLDELDREEQAAESHENELTMERRIAGLPAVSPDHLEAEAAANEREATVQIERARLLRREARSRRTRVIQFPSPSLSPS